MSGKEMPFEDLDAWKKARILTARIYAISSKGLFSRDFGLRDQMRRASISIMSNIAEGWQKPTSADRIRFMAIAKASASELRSQLYIALDVGYLQESDFEVVRGEINTISRMLSGLIRSLENSDRSVGGNRNPPSTS